MTDLSLDYGNTLYEEDFALRLQIDELSEVQAHLDQVRQAASWICSACTFENDNRQADHCEVCSGDRVSQGATDVLPKATWRCSMFTFDNEDTSVVCAVCECPMPGLGDKGSRAARPAHRFGTSTDLATAALLEARSRSATREVARQVRPARSVRYVEEDVLAQIAMVEAAADGDPRLVGAQQNDIALLPTHRVSAHDLASAPAEAKSCAICMDDFALNDEQKCLPCFHKFHVHCIDEWLRRNGCCPVCKHRVSNEDGS